MSESNGTKKFSLSDLQKPIVRSLKVKIGDEEGLIYYRSVSGRYVSDLFSGDSDDNGVERMAKKLSQQLVDENGELSATFEQVMELPAETINLIMVRITQELNKEIGLGEEDLKTTPSSA